MSNYIDYFFITAIFFLVSLIIFDQKLVIMYKYFQSFFNKNHQIHAQENSINSLSRNDLLEQELDKLENLDPNEQNKLSWKFLNEISDLVEKKFSAHDQDIINNARNILHSQNVRYLHDIREELLKIARNNLQIKIRNRKSNLKT